LQAAYQRDETRHIAERAETVGAAMQIEQNHLLPLQEGFE
jgi:hypothetical protein